MLKVAKAIVGGAFAASLISSLALFVWSATEANDFGTNVLISLIILVAATFLVALGVASTLGLAWHSLASAQGWRGVNYYCIPGALTGVVPVLIAFIQWPAMLLPLSLFAGALGGLTALFAWLIRRPDRDVANPPTSPQ